ncbi:MAG: peptidase P60 [Epsilonproteobacteria bacterium]|nr:peptidase P60 [Campylobacterota bacterium]
MRTLFLLLFSLAWFLAGCAPQQPQPRLVASPKPFLSQITPIPKPQSARLYANLLARRYRPWQDPFVFRQSDALWAGGFYPKKATYGLNRRPLTPAHYRRWQTNARYEALNSLNKKAIVTYPTNLRLFPTADPIFYRPDRPGEGYPFDYNQNSTVKPLTPLRVSHLSADRAWAYVVAPFATGWVSVRDIAYVDEQAVQTLSSAPLAVILDEHKPLYGPNGAFLFYAKSATLLPLAEAKTPPFKALIPYRGYLQTVTLPQTAVARMPLPMTPQTVSRVIQSLLNEPYGWGGLGGKRDCSAMTRDFFMPFGIWLPRNSRAQAKVGRVIDLSKLSPKQKERRIIEEGVPFQTLLYLPGHIMLYIGHQKGRAYVMHNTWGIKTKTGGRHIIGQAVISTLYLGQNLPDTDKKSLLINRIQSMNIVTENVLQ